MRFTAWTRFSKVPASVKGQPGLYEIRRGRTLLKVGIAGNLWKRLKQHKESLQRRLKGPRRQPWVRPQMVTSKGSILAKHLYFDTALARGYDLRMESDRQRFLEDQCEVRWQIYPNRESARRREAKLEKTHRYRYCREVRVQ